MLTMVVMAAGVDMAGVQDGASTGCIWVNNNRTCPFPYVGMPYTIPASAPAAQDLGPDAGLAIFPKKINIDKFFKLLIEAMSIYSL